MNQNLLQKPHKYFQFISNKNVILSFVWNDIFIFFFPRGVSFLEISVKFCKNGGSKLATFHIHVIYIGMKNF